MLTTKIICTTERYKFVLFGFKKSQYIFFFMFENEWEKKGTAHKDRPRYAGFYVLLCVALHFQESKQTFFKLA